MSQWDRSDTEEVAKGVLTALLVTALAWAFDRLGDEIGARIRKARAK